MFLQRCLGIITSSNRHLLQTSKPTARHIHLSACQNFFKKAAATKPQAAAAKPPPSATKPQPSAQPQAPPPKSKEDLLQALRDSIFTPIALEKTFKRNRKVTIVGANAVGVSSALNLLTSHAVDEISLIDVEEQRLQGLLMDLAHSRCLLSDVKLNGGADYCHARGSSVIVLAAGAVRQSNESLENFYKRSIMILQEVMPELISAAPEAILLLACEPVEILTALTFGMATMPSNRVLGTGTSLDTARFRHFIAERLGVATSACQALIIGEHGANCLPIWSTVSVGGLPLMQLNPAIGTEKDPDNWLEVLERTRKADEQIQQLQGSKAAQCMALNVARIVDVIVNNKREVLPVTTLARCHYGIETDVWLSLPCILGTDGVSAVLKQKLTEAEQSSLQEAGKRSLEMREKLK